MFKKIKQNFKNSKVFIPLIVVSSLTLSFFLIVFKMTDQNSIVVLFSILLFDIVIIFLLGGIRVKELNEVKKVIARIRKNEISKPSDIELSRNLNELEDEIQAMFFRTQSDIANLKHLEQVRTEFLGNVSHELRTPIFAIQGYIETLLDGAINDPKVNLNFLQKANHHTINLNNLLNDLIDISMIESGQMKMSFRYFNVIDFVENVIAEFKPEIFKKNLELIFISENQKLELYGDKQRLKQALVNLITNAIKYTETGSITIGIQEEENSGRIFVKDTGFGIAENDQKRIFERFYRVDKERTRELGGTGLGLAIVKHIIEAHASRVELISQIGLGSEFSFRLKK